MNVSVDKPVRCWQVWEYDNPTYETNTPTWELIVDPSDSMIIGGLFSSLDITVTGGSPREVWDNWATGTRFRNTKSGKVIEIYRITKHHNYKNRIYSKTYVKYKVVKPSDQMELMV